MVVTVVREGPFNVGDTIKIDGVENSDGSFAVTRVGSATPEDIAGLPKFGDDNSTDDDNSNGGDGSNDNGGDGNDNGGDDNSNDG